GKANYASHADLSRGARLPAACDNPGLLSAATGTPTECSGDSSRGGLTNPQSRYRRIGAKPQFVDKGGKAVWLAGDGWRHGLGIGRVGGLSKCLIGGGGIGPAGGGSRVESRQ